MNKMFCSLFAVTVALAPGWALAQPALAQAPSDAQAGSSAKSDEAGQGLADIVVTAQRRSENLQNVPVAVTAVTAMALEAKNIATVLDLGVTVPGLNVTSSVGYITPFLRGIGSVATGPGIENPIATYVDGVYYGAPLASLLQFSNISQVEVLKGPQGTLFGRNATGGLIQVTTLDPTQELSGKASVSYGNYNTISADAYIAGGLTDTLRADIAVRGSHQGDGWGTNIATGRDVYKVDHDIAVRSKWVFEPADGTKFTLIGDYSDERGSLTQLGLLEGTISAFTPTPVNYPHRYDVDVTKESTMNGWQAGGSLRIDQDVGNLKLASITAYRRSNYYFFFDYDGAPIQFLTIDGNQKDRQFSQELQLMSSGGGAFNWVVGAFYYNAEGQFAPVDVTLYGLGFGSRVNSSQKTESIAGYAQGTYEFAPGTKLTLGGRYTSERKALLGTNTNFLVPGNILLPSDPTVDKSRRDNKFTFRAALDHRFSNELLGYVSFNRGFKSGGFNPGLPPLNDGYRPEVLDSYEVGLKSNLFDRRVRLNAAAFYYDYQDLQVKLIQGGTTGVVNGGAAKIYGMEAELEAKVTQQLTFSAGMALLHSEFTSFPGAPTSVPLGGVPPTLQSAKGNKLPNAPARTFNAGIDYLVPIAQGTLRFNGTFYYNSGWAAEPDNVIKQGSFSQINGSIKWTAPNNLLSLSLYGRNLTNKQVMTYESTSTFDGAHFVQWAAPRTYGVKASLEF